MEQNLSYSLTFHLVESAFAFFLFAVLPLTPSQSAACRNVADSMPFSGLTFGDFGASFEKSLGRTAELSPEQEVRLFPFLSLDRLSLPRFSQLLASVYMHFGTQFTNHSVRLSLLFMLAELTSLSS
jgi:hypothetical protein